MSLQSLSCTILYWLTEYPALLLLPVTPLVVVVYRLTHPVLLPGHPSTLTLLLPGSHQSHPYSATLSPLSYLRARWALYKYARSRGYKNASAFVETMREDEEYDWVNGEKPKRGDLVRGWDRVMVWDKDCIDLDVLESWRNLSDPLSDQALVAAQHRSNADVMLQIAQHKLDCNAGRAKSDSDLTDFWQAVNRRPPRGSGAVGLQWYKDNNLISDDEYRRRAECNIDEAFTSSLETWHSGDEEFETPTADELREEADILRRGKEMFYRYGPPILVGLMHVGLSGGFASPRITEVLKATGYLMSGSKKGSSSQDPRERLQENIGLVESALDKAEKESPSSSGSTLPSKATSERTFRRLLETTTFVLDVMETEDSLTPPSCARQNKMIPTDGKDLLGRGGSGWLSACRVRFIHTTVRKRLSPDGNLAKSYDAASGIAINQEDLLATLTSFSIAPLYTLQRMGLSPSQQERSDYIALWRHIGFYMGIEPRLLERVFRDVDSAERYFCCVASHHFLGVTRFKYQDPCPAISSNFGKDLEEVRRFQFNQGPALPLLYSVASRPPGNMSFSTLCCLSRYLLGRSLANAVSLPDMTTSQYLGVRLRLFILSFPPLFARYYPRRQFEVSLRENCRDLLRRVIIWSLKGDTVSFDSDRDQKKTGEKIDIGVAEGNRLRLQYFALMGEMVAVTAFLGIAALFSLRHASHYIISALANLHQHQCTI